MTDKKTFGLFIKTKRTEKNYSQKDLAELLFVTEGAISKWERGVSYPDITLIADICRVLDISEHELITASTDTEQRKLKREAKHFRTIRSVWFWIPTLSYLIALIPCFICDLAINHKFTWFYIVLAALLCAYSFVPTFTFFFKRGKLLAFSGTSFLSICLLLLTCAAYTSTMFWLPTACIGVLMGYILLFVPILLSGTALRRWRFMIAVAAVCALTIVILLSIYTWQAFMLDSAILITIYAYIPLLLCAVLCALDFDGFLKAGICTAVTTVVYYCTGHVTNFLFHLQENHYEVDFHDWTRCVTGNVHFIVLTSMLLISAVFFGIGFVRIRKSK